MTGLKGRVCVDPETIEESAVMTRLERRVREEVGFRLYELGRRLVNAAARLDPTITTETSPSAPTLAYGLGYMGLWFSEMVALAEARAKASGKTLGEVMARPNSERLLPR